MTWDEFVPRVLPWTSGCPDQVVVQHVVQAARDFCERTSVWTVISDPLLTSVGLALYPLDLDEQQERVKLIDAWVDNRRTKVVDSRLGRALARRGCGSFLYLEGPLDIAVYPAPTADGKEVVVQMAVKPTLAADEWPDDLAEYVLDISYGAISTLSRLPKKEWTDRQQAADYRLEFENRVSSVAIKAAQGFTGRNPRGPSRFL